MVGDPLLLLPSWPESLFGREKSEVPAEGSILGYLVIKTATRSFRGLFNSELRRGLSPFLLCRTQRWHLM